MSDRFMVGTRKGLFIYARSGNGWKIRRRAFLGDQVPMTLADPRDGTLYAALNHGHFGNKLHRSTDGGEIWEEIAAPVYPEPPEGQEDRCPMRDIPIPWNLELIWSLEPGGADEPGVLWCGTIPGGLFRSRDRGESWEIIRPLWDDPKRRMWFGGGYDYPGIHSVIVDPRDSNHVSVGVSCGGVWVTRDGGETWACKADGMRNEYTPPDQAQDPNTQDAHRVVACPARPDHLWTQHHNGIFRSTDDSESWTEIGEAGPSAFGFVAAVHPQDPNTAWFVPGIKDEKRIPVDGKLVVTRTRDGGESFDVLSGGLPREDAYDIVLRHAMEVDETGENLVFGTTTGNLFVSNDGGDSWSALSHHLPPVYCVRFVK